MALYIALVAFFLWEGSLIGIVLFPWSNASLQPLLGFKSNSQREVPFDIVGRLLREEVNHFEPSIISQGSDCIVVDAVHPNQSVAPRITP